jgi:hypothetical protein
MPPLLYVSNNGLDSFADAADNSAVTGYLRFQHDSGTNKGTINLGGATGGGGGLFINNVLTPTDGSHAANKQYVDDRVNGLSVKGPVKAATPYSGSVLDQHQASDVDQHHTGEHNVDLASLYVGSPYLTGTGIDGVTEWQVGDRVLLLDQVNCVENGIWVLGATAGDLARPLDFLDGSSAAGAYAFVDRGQHNADRSFVCVTDTGGDVVGTNDLHWHQYSRRPEALAGAGLKVSGDEANALDVRTDTFVVGGTDGNVASGGTLEVVDDQVRIRGGTVNAVLGDKMNTLTKDNTFTSVSGSSGTTTGAVTVTGGVGIGENLHVGGRQSINSANAAGALEGAALSVLGGADIAMDVHIKSTNNLVAGGALTVAGAVQVDLEMQVDGHITTPYADLTNVWATTDISGVAYPVQYDTQMESQLQRAVNREYIRNTFRAHQWKASARVASTQNYSLVVGSVAPPVRTIPAVYNHGASMPGMTLNQAGNGSSVYYGVSTTPYTVDRYNAANLLDGQPYRSIVWEGFDPNHDGVDHAGFRRRMDLKGPSMSLTELPYSRFNFDMGSAVVFDGMNYAPAMNGATHVFSMTVFGSNDPAVMDTYDATFTADGTSSAIMGIGTVQERAASITGGTKLLELRRMTDDSGANALHGQYVTKISVTDPYNWVTTDQTGTPVNINIFKNNLGGAQRAVQFPTAPVDLSTAATYRYICVVYACYYTGITSTQHPMELMELSPNVVVGGPTLLASGVQVDGTILATGDRVLLKDQSDSTENGLYTITDGAPVRAVDMNVGFATHGSLTVITGGAINGDRAFLVTSDAGADVVGEHPLQFSMLGQSPSQLSGSVGTALGTTETESGTSLQVIVDTERLGIDPDAIYGAGTIEINGEGEMQIRGGAQNAVLGDTVNNLQERNNFNSTEGSISATTGALVVTGGVGIGQDLNIGGHQRIDSTKLAGDGAGPALEVAGGVKVAQDLHVNATTASTNSTNGALVVAGGMGVAGSLHVGSDNLLGDVNGPAMTVQGSLQTGQQVSVQSNELARAGGDTGPDAALRVEGGVNVAEDVLIRSIKDVGDVDGAALEVRGGVHIAKVAKIDANEAANSQTSGSLRVSGGVGVTGQVHCQGVFNYSDRRLKTNIENLGPEALDRVNRLNGCTFNWQATGAADVGVIAQDVQREAPHCVNMETEFLSVNYGKLVPYLIEGIKELSNQVGILQGEVGALKRQLEVREEEEDVTDIRSTKRQRHCDE